MKSWALQYSCILYPHPAPSRPAQARRSGPGCALALKGEGRGAASRNALSTRGTGQTGSFKVPNQSQASERPIAMAAELPESDKAPRPSFPCLAVPSPALPGATLGARSDGLITVKTKR